MGKLNTVKNGKGPEDRVTDYNQFWDNYGLIDWSKKDAKKPSEKSTEDNKDQKELIS
jgi:hypothetical protein